MSASWCPYALYGSSLLSNSATPTPTTNLCWGAISSCSAMTHDDTAASLPASPSVLSPPPAPAPVCRPYICTAPSARRTRSVLRRPSSDRQRPSSPLADPGACPTAGRPCRPPPALQGRRRSPQERRRSVCGRSGSGGAVPWGRVAPVKDPIDVSGWSTRRPRARGHCPADGRMSGSVHYSPADEST